MKKLLLMSLAGLAMCLTALAQRPVSGKYYRIVNQNPDKSVTTSGVRYGYCITEDLISNRLTANDQGGDDQYNQIWKYTGTMFQNAHTLRYIGDVYGSTQAETATTGKAVSIEDKDGNYLIKSGNGQYLHADGGNAIVGWYDTSNSSNWWNFEEVSVDAKAMEAAQDEYKQQQLEKTALMAIVDKANVYAPIVENYFTDKGCTTLKLEFDALTDDDFKTRMTTDGLPEQLQTMVLGIKNKWKDEFNSAMSERFRVQSYKIYTRCNDEGTNANSPKWTVRASQMSDRNNPTGIWTDALQLMYVFVEDEIPAGATLKIAGASGSGVIGLFDYHGTELKQGMNIIYCGLNYTTQWIMYTCAADYTKPLSTYPEIKIHIEGGEVLGYVNKHPGDEDATNAEYASVLNNAMKLMKAKSKNMAAINFSVKGERGVFEFPVDTYRQIWSSESKWDAKIYKSINFYDNVLKWEWSNMGWQDRVESGEADNDLENLAAGGGDAFWPTYINNLAPTMQCPDGKNPYSGDSHTGMPGTWAVESSYNAEREDFDVWCCGHESGHNNQSTINLPSCTESSNNFFSNVITTQYGYRMGRGWSFKENFDAYGYGKTVFCQRDISITMRMWYNLWLYYHQAGHNKKFMPTLFKLLRADLMSFGGEGWHNGKFGGGNKGNATTSWLKFYEKACEAAEEDLTEYFRMWGFLTPTSEAAGDYIEVINGKHYAYCGDYSSYYVHAEKADIEAAIARVKARGWRENLEVMFIEDRQLLRQRHDPWAKEGDMKLYNWGAAATAESLQADYGNVGDVKTFIDGSANTSDYKYMLVGNHITLIGKGGAGFIVYDKDGNIAYLSNMFEFDLPAEVAAGGFTITTINADGTKSDVVDMTLSANNDEKKMLLEAALKSAAAYTAMEDPTGKKVGLYSTESITPLKNIVAEAQTALKGSNVDRYVELFNKLNAEVLRVQAEVTPHQIENGTLYTIRSVRNTERVLATSGSKLSGGQSASSDAAKWMFVPAGDKNDGTYYLQNRNNRKLLRAILNAKKNVEGLTMTDEIPADITKVKVEPLGNGKFGVRPMNKTYVNIDPSNNIATWGSADEGSQWTIEEAGKLEEVTEEMFSELIAQSRKVLSDVCDVTVTPTQYTLTAASVSTNAPGEASCPVSNVTDGYSGTYFCSNQNNAAADEPHNIVVDLGDGVQTKNIKFTIYGYNKSGYNYPKNVYVYGSNNKTSWTKVGNINGTKIKVESTVLRSSTAFRYWKLDVMSTTGKATDNGTYPWFAVTRLEVYDAAETVTKKGAFDVTSITSNMLTNLIKNIDEAELQQNAFFQSALSDYVVYENLKSAYNKLYKAASAIDPTVNIDGIEAEGNSDGAIYDLSGRKVNNTAKRGIYIVNGKKVLR